MNAMKVGQCTLRRFMHRVLQSVALVHITFARWHILFLNDRNPLQQTEEPNRRNFMDLADQLQKLQTLREQGALTEDEFIIAKKRVLDGSASQYSAEPAPSSPPSQSASILHQFRLSTTDKWIGGVCGGLARLSNIPSWSWRILFLLAVLLHGIGVLVYILLWIFVPIQSSAPPVATEEKM